ncbi:MAG TPA: phage terminase large subunit [Spirochaetota bacterium]|nr:phage terminase large subunit [Spirochaetota bacterium]HQQ24271.1 phage terminase large subunit [Spirochaetota bacterium]
MKVTKTFEMLCDYRNIPVKIVKGGTRSGKTYGILQYKVIDVEKNKRLTSVVSETFPHLKKGAYRDFKNIIEEMGGTLNRYNFNGTDFIWKNKLEFFSADSGKAHGPGRQDLFLNEIQNIDYETAFHLMQRTENEIVLDYNPTHYFWIDEMYLDNPKKQNGKDYILIHSTIFDNPFVSENIKRMVLDRAEIDPNYKRVYLDGETGTIEGLIYHNWEITKEFPTNYAWRYIGLDFGFTNHPTAALDMRYTDGKVWEKELIYETGLLPVPNIAGEKNIVDELLKLGITKDVFIIADSAEEKTIKQIKAYFPNIIGIKKPPGSVMSGIGLVQQQRIMVEENSTNIIKEKRTYSFAPNPKPTNPTDKYLNDPIKANDHLQDAERYVIMYVFGQTPRGFW